MSQPRPPVLATMKPSHTIVAKDAAEFAVIKAHLTKIGYPLGKGVNAERVDDLRRLTITVRYPDWALPIEGM